MSDFAEAESTTLPSESPNHPSLPAYSLGHIAPIYQSYPSRNAPPPQIYRRTMDSSELTPSLGRKLRRCCQCHHLSHTGMERCVACIHRLCHSCAYRPQGDVRNTHIYEAATAQQMMSDGSHSKAQDQIEEMHALFCRTCS